MNRRIPSAASAVLVLFAACSSTKSEPPIGDQPFYDPLDGAALDGAHWQTPQFGRSIEGGVAVISVRADAMEARTLQGATYTNAVTVLASGRRVTTFGATVSVPAASAARSGGAVLLGGIRLVYQPAANRGGLFPTANMNILSASLELFQYGAGLELRRRFYHCDDAPCVALGGSGISVVDPAGFTRSGVNATAPAAFDTTYTLEVSLDEATGTFTWTAQGGAYGSPLSGTADISAWASSVGMALGTANNGFTGAQLFARASDETGGGAASVAARFDDVRVGFDGAAATTWDDFASGTFGPLKWGAIDSDAWLSGGSLHLASEITTAADGFASEGTVVIAMYPAMFESWQADVAIVADSPAPAAGSSDVAGILGAFYNDGTAGTGASGDVRARVNLGVDQASYSIFKCTVASCGPTTPIAAGPLTPSAAHPLGLGTVHALSIRWDATAKLFAFGLDDAPPVEVDPTSVPGALAPVSSPTPRYPLHGLATTVLVSAGATAGTTARVEATFANVRGAPP